MGKLHIIRFSDKYACFTLTLFISLIAKMKTIAPLRNSKFLHQNNEPLLNATNSIQDT